MSSSLPRILLSRFIINLRDVDVGPPTSNLSITQAHSRGFVLSSYMPTINGVIGNLGEPLDFVDYRIKNDEGVKRDHAGAQIDRASDGERRDTHTTPSSNVRSSNNAEAADAEEVQLEEPEVCQALLIYTTRHSELQMDLIIASTDALSLHLNTLRYFDAYCPSPLISSPQSFYFMRLLQLFLADFLRIC